MKLALDDGSEGIILNLRNVFYLPNSPSNLISLSLLNNAGIYYNNEQQALYDKANRKPFAFAQRWERSFFIHPLNLSVSAANLLKAEGDLYQDTRPKMHQTQRDKHPLTVWHKRFVHLNFPALRRHLAHHNISTPTMSAYGIAAKRQKQQSTTIARPRRERRGRISSYTQTSLGQSRQWDLEPKGISSHLHITILGSRRPTLEV